METATYDPTGLIAGPFPIVSSSGTMLLGQNNPRGTVLGRILTGAATAAAKAGGNTGTGTFVLDATTPKLAGVKVGVYTLRCIAAVANGGVFRLTDPDGIVLGDFTIPAGAGNTVTVDRHIKGALAYAGTDFAAGDGFDITVAAGSKKLVKSLAASVDGSEKPWAILAADVDASAADRPAPYYLSGEFATSKLTFGTGHTADTVEEAFRAVSAPIFLKVLN